MGADLHVRILKYNPKTRFYDELKLFRLDEEDKNVYNTVYIDAGRDSEMFDGMTDGEAGDNDYDVFPLFSIRIESYEENFKNEIETYQSTFGYYNFYEINLSDYKSYLLEHPTVIDYGKNCDVEVEKMPRKENPLGALFKKIVQYAAFADEDSWITPLSEYKVIFFFDH